MDTRHTGEFQLDARNVALSAVFAAAVAVGTLAVSIPVGIGYLNFGEVLIYTAAFLFGPVVGAIAGGVGAAAADVYLGFTMWAPITFVLKGIEGAIVGYLSGDSTRSKVIAVAAGAPIMIVGYVAVVAYLEGIPVAVASELPIDILQAVAGLVVAVPLTTAVESRVPQLR
jgi:uncharacterized membrane protein